MYLRHSLKNCSHIQQAIDQHLGQIVKILFKRLLEDMMQEIDLINTFGGDHDIGTEKMREITIRFVSAATQIVNVLHVIAYNFLQLHVITYNCWMLVW